jgi:hypothetical protein
MPFDRRLSMTTIRTAILALLLGAGVPGFVQAAVPEQAAATQPARAVALDGNAELHAEMAERLDPRVVALIALAIGAVGIGAGIRRRRALETAPGIA